MKIISILHFTFCHLCTMCTYKKRNNMLYKLYSLCGDVEEKQGERERKKGMRRRRRRGEKYLVNHMSHHVPLLINLSNLSDLNSIALWTFLYKSVEKSMCHSPTIAFFFSFSTFFFHLPSSSSALSLSLFCWIHLTCSTPLFCSHTLSSHNLHEKWMDSRSHFSSDKSNYLQKWKMVRFRCSVRAAILWLVVRIRNEKEEMKQAYIAWKMAKMIEWIKSVIGTRLNHHTSLMKRKTHKPKIPKKRAKEVKRKL